MVKAQEYLDQHYPQNQRIQITELDISQQNLEGSLKLKGFINLENFNCYNNELTELDLASCSSLQSIDCHDNHLIKIKLPKLEERLKYLSLNNNNFPEQDLSFLSSFVNLLWLQLENDNQEKIQQGIYNRFSGSLKPLKNLRKLTVLSIDNTDIGSGLEYLPDSSEEYQEFHCLADKRPEAKVKAIYNLFTNNKGEIETEVGCIKNFSQKLKEYKQKIAQEKFSQLQNLLAEIKSDLVSYQNQLHSFQKGNRQLQLENKQLNNSFFLSLIEEQLSKNELILTEKTQQVKQLQERVGQLGEEFSNLQQTPQILHNPPRTN